MVSGPELIIDVAEVILKGGSGRASVLEARCVPVIVDGVMPFAEIELRVVSIPVGKASLIILARSRSVPH